MFQIFRTATNYHQVNKDNGIVTGISNLDAKGKPYPSVTEPDEVFSLKQLIDRQRSGQYVPILDQQYEDDLMEFKADWPDTSKMTKIELQEFAEQVGEFITDQRKVINEYNKKVKEDKESTEQLQQTSPANTGAEENNE